ncbi:hypothetical protein FRC11_003536 [Ceratobasidium sp. 423]|nr:hypothetical protein FRC11_003536 [Ceratobasidium sp. 423]
MITQNTWEQHYKLDDYDNGNDTTSQSQFGYSTFADQVYSSFAEENDKPVDPVTDFVEGKPILECLKSGKSKPVNPLNWWYAKRLAGEEHDGLTQMALDILTALASSVEVECAFSFVSSLVSKCRHRMSAYTIQSTATLGAYSHADLVPVGILEKGHRKAREHNQANAQAKATKAKAKAAAAEVEVIAAEQEQLGAKDGGDESDKDVLELSSEVEDIDLKDD